MHQIFLEALDLETVSSLFEVYEKSSERNSLWSKILKIELEVVSEELFQL